nr:amidohydrolase family protein [Micromonospora sp. DSM 115978]
MLDDQGQFGDPVDVAVTGRHVSAVGRNLPTATNSADEIVDVDGAGLWLMPGVFDCHTYLSAATYDPFELLTLPVSARHLETAANLRKTLAAGVTYARDAGGADAGVRASVVAGHVPGPRMQISVAELRHASSPGDGALTGPALRTPLGTDLGQDPARPAELVDGAAAMRRAVRGVLRAGADWVKIHGSSGVLSARPGEPQPEFSAGEIAVAVAEAATFGRGVMVQALGATSVRAAVDAGARSIEGGFGLTEREAALMASLGVTLVPALAALYDLEAAAQAGELPAWAVDRVSATMAKATETVAVARAAGVRVALGSGARHRDRHGSNLAEITHLHQAGLRAPEALLAATAAGARLCGVADRVGRSAPGYEFDAALLDHDPSDLSLFTRQDAVSGVFLGGVPAVRHPRLPAAVRSVPVRSTPKASSIQPPVSA